jgi:hypothetical protein
MPMRVLMLERRFAKRLAGVVAMLRLVAFYQCLEDTI